MVVNTGTTLAPEGVQARWLYAIVHTPKEECLLEDSRLYGSQQAERGSSCRPTV